jgi:hypothetical protein
MGGRMSPAELMDMLRCHLEQADATERPLGSIREHSCEGSLPYMFVLTFNTGVYCVTRDEDAAQQWADLGENFHVTEAEPEDFQTFNDVMDLVAEFEAEDSL